MSEQEVKKEEIKEETKVQEEVKPELTKEGEQELPVFHNGRFGEGEGESDSEGDVMFVDDDFLKEMDGDGDETDDDFKTMKESSIGTELG